MGYISNNNLNKLLPLSTTQPHLPLTQSCDINGNDHHHQLITASSSALSAATSRWNPTPEQITSLEKIYRSGTRTPTTEQIQQIASKLRKYGRIEGKNVFYWFQNHKARERSKRRRREEDDINNDHESHKDVKDSSSSGAGQTKSSPSFPQPQHEMVSANNNDEDHGMREEFQRALDKGKDATWRELVTWSVTQEEEARKIRTLNLFPVMENQEKNGRFIEKQNAKKANQVTCCNYCYYYEFMPLKN